MRLIRKTPVPDAPPFDVSAMQREIEDQLADAIPRRPAQILEDHLTPLPQLPEYAAHAAGVPRVGMLTAEAVAVDYEAAAKEIEELGKQLTAVQKRMEAETQAVHDAIVEVKALAQRYRDEGLRLFNSLEECSLLTQRVRETCSDLASTLK